MVGNIFIIALTVTNLFLLIMLYTKSEGRHNELISKIRDLEDQLKKH